MKASGNSSHLMKLPSPSKESPLDFLLALVPVVRELSVEDFKEASIKRYSFDAVIGLIIANIKIMKAQHTLLKRENARLRKKVEELSQVDFWLGGNK
jgi:hypothetical protein